MRGLTSTIVLIVVLAGLGAYIYFVDSKRPDSTIEPKDKVFTVESDKLEELRITAEQQTSVVQKKDGTWRLLEPMQADADQTEVSSLATSLAGLEVNRVVEENAADLAQYGLADPRIKVEFKGQNNASGQLLIGEKTATGSDVYALRGGEKRVFLLSAFNETSFNKKPFDLRDKRVLKFDRDKADLLEIAQGTSVIQLARSGTEWVVKQPVQARGDYSAVEGLLTRLSSTNMTKIVEGATLDKPAVTVSIGSGSARASLAIGEEKDGEVLARDLSREMVFAVDPTFAADLKKTVDEYRDKDVFEFRTFNIDVLRVSRGSESYEFKKVRGTGENATDTWQRVNAGGATTDADTTKVEDLLTKLSNLRAQSFVASATPATPLTVSASFDSGKFERARIGTAGADTVAVRDGEPGAAKIDASGYEEAIKALDALVAPPPPPAANASPSGNTSPAAPSGNASPAKP